MAAPVAQLPEFKMNNHKYFSGVLYILLTVLFSAKITAADVTGNTLTLKDAIGATLKNNPQITGFHFREAAVKSEGKIAAVRPPVEISADLENAFGDDEYADTDSAEFTLTLSKVIELGGKRSARLDINNEQQQKLSIEKKILELDLLTEVSRQFVNVVASQHRLALQSSAIELAEKTVHSVKKRVDVGRAPVAELARAKATLIQSRLAHSQAKRTLKIERVRLASLWGASQANFGSAQADLLTLTPPEPLEKLLGRLENNPDISIFTNKTRIREAELKLARSERWPSIEPSLGYRQFEETDNSALTLGLTLPLFNSQRAKGATAKVRAEQQDTENQLANALLKRRTKLFSLYQEYLQAIEEVEALKTDVLPQLKKALIETQKAYNKGRYSYLDWKAAQQERLDVELTLINTASHAHHLYTEIERLNGKALAEKTRGKK